jgi:hypothetical protein
MPDIKYQSRSRSLAINSPVQTTDTSKLSSSACRSEQGRFLVRSAQSWSTGSKRVMSAATVGQSRAMQTRDERGDASRHLTMMRH